MPYSLPNYRTTRDNAEIPRRHSRSMHPIALPIQTYPAILRNEGDSYVSHVSLAYCLESHSLGGRGSLTCSKQPLRTHFFFNLDHPQRHRESLTLPLRVELYLFIATFRWTNRTRTLRASPLLGIQGVSGSLSPLLSVLPQVDRVCRSSGLSHGRCDRTPFTDLCLVSFTMPSL